MRHPQGANERDTVHLRTVLPMPLTLVRLSEHEPGTQGPRLRADVVKKTNNDQRPERCAFQQES